MDVLLTGSAGQLGRAVLEELPPDHDVHPTYHETLPADLPDGPRMPVEDRDRVQEVVQEVDPDAVLHAAALTDVDACEADRTRARRVNVDGTDHLAAAAAEAAADFVLVSTDYVFGGDQGDHDEDDAVDPVNTYGRSKALAEDRARDRHPAPVIARPSVVHGPHLENFVTWVVDRLREAETTPLITDQRVTPTYTPDLARQIQALLEAGASGVWHTAGGTSLTRYEMGEAVADALGADPDLLEPSTMADLPWDAPRPHDSSLSTRKIRKHHDPLPFREAVDDLLERLPQS